MVQRNFSARSTGLNCLLDLLWDRGGDKTSNFSFSPFQIAPPKKAITIFILANYGSCTCQRVRLFPPLAFSASTNLLKVFRRNDGGYRSAPFSTITSAIIPHMSARNLASTCASAATRRSSYFRAKIDCQQSGCGVKPQFHKIGRIGQVSEGEKRGGGCIHRHTSAATNRQ